MKNRINEKAEVLTCYVNTDGPNGRIADLLIRTTMLLDDEAVKFLVETGEMDLPSRLSDKGGVAFLGFGRVIEGKMRFCLVGAAKTVNDGIAIVSHCAYIAPEDTTPDEMADMVRTIVRNVCEANGATGITPVFKVEDAPKTQNN